MEDFENGKISKILFKFAIPCITSLLIGALYNMVDQIFIGNSELGFLGNAATGVSFPIICVVNAFAWSIGDGGAASLSIYNGRNEMEKMNNVVGTSISSALIISIILSIISLVFSVPLLTLFGASENTIGMANDYFRIIALFFPFYLLSNIFNGFIRSDGSPGLAMLLISLGAIINIILDPIFIFVFKLGIKGAAYATIIGQFVSFVAQMLYLFKPKTFKLSFKSFKIDLKILKQTIMLGGATFITQISIAVMSVVSNMTLFKFGELSKYGSDIPIAVFSIQTKVYTIVNNIIVGIALGAQPLLGYSYGANRMDRVKDTFKLALTLSVIVGLVATIIFEACPGVIINLFGSGDALYNEFAIKTFRIYLSLSIVTGIIKVSTIFFQSIGKSKEAFIASLMKELLCFVPLTLILSFILEANMPGSGIYGILYAAPISDVIAGSVIIILIAKFFHSFKLDTPKEIEL